MYAITQPFHQVQAVTQGQFFKWSKAGLDSVFLLFDCLANQGKSIQYALPFKERTDRCLSQGY